MVVVMAGGRTGRLQAPQATAIAMLRGAWQIGVDQPVEKATRGGGVGRAERWAET